MKKLILGVSLLVSVFGFGQVTENYQMQTGNFNASFTEKNNQPPFTGTFNNNSTELGQFANSGSFGNTPGAAVFRDFTIDGFDETATDRDLKVGDEFTITVFTSSNPSAGGRIGISFRNNRTYTDFFSSTDGNTVARFQLDDSGGWKIYTGGQTGGTQQHENTSATPGSDRTLTIKITSTNTFNATIDGTTYHDISFSNSGPIQSFSIYTFGDSNPDSFWKDASLTNTTSVEIGGSNNSFTLSGDITDGLNADSDVTVSNNELIKNGTGDVTLSSTSNSYSGNTTINDGSIILGSAGVIPDASNMILNGGSLSSGATTGNNETIGTLDLDASSSIDLGSGSHALTFANSSTVNWSGGAVLTINNWSGTAGTSGSGSAGTINLGSSGLSSGQLDQIQFDGYPQGAVLSGGEVVPELGALPTTNATNLSFDNIGRTRMDISWTNGDGDNRIVLLKAGSSVDASPDSGTTYAENAAFGSGDEIGTGNFVVYNGSGSSVTVTGLTAGTTYHIEVFEYNGSSGSESYLDPGLDGNQVTTTDYLTVASGTLDWNTAADWLDNTVPPTGASVVIRSNMTLDTDATVSNLTINSGATLTSQSGQSRTLSIEDGGSFTNDGTFTANDGTVSFPGDGTITANAPTTFNDVDIAGGVNFGSGPLIDGTLTVNAGGFADTNSPIYGTASTLDFDTGGNYDINSGTTLWTTGSTVGSGVPFNVTVTSSSLNMTESRDVTGSLSVENSGSITTSNAANLIVGVNATINGSITTGTGTFEVVANLTNAGTFDQGGLVDVGANFINQLNTGNYTNNSDDRIIVGSNFENQSGANFTLSSTIGGDLEVKGNFTDNGTFNANSRAVFFTGANSQTVNSATDPLTIDFLIIDKSSNNVQMLQNLDLPNDLELNNGNLDLNGNTLTISGDIRPNNGNGTIEGSATGSTLLFDVSSTARTIEADDIQNDEIANLTFDESAGITLNTDLQVTGTFDINAGNNFLEGGYVLDIDGATMDVASAADLTFKSNPADASTNAGSAQLAEITNPSGTTINGNVTTERYFTDNRAFRLIAPSVSTSSTSYIRDNWQEGVNNTGTNFPADNQNPHSGFGTHITGSTTGANGFDATPSGNPSLFTFDNANLQWNAISDTDNTTLSAGETYRLFIRGDRGVNLTSNSATPTETRIRTTGSLSTGNIGSGTLQTDQPHFIGNPYQASVDLSALSLGNIRYAFIWDPTINTRGAYVTVDIDNNTNAIKDPNFTGSGTSDADKYLQPQQAVFLDVPASPGITSFDFTEASKATSQAQTTVFSDDNTNNDANISLRLLKNNSGSLKLTDGLKVRFKPNGDNGKTVNDARKVNNLDESIASVVNNQLISIEERAIPTDGESIQLFTAEYRTDDYIIEMSHQGLPDDLDLLLTDHYTDESHIIGSGLQQISFSVDSNIPESEAWNRFTLDFVTTLSTDEEIALDFKVYPNPSNDGQVNIQMPNAVDQGNIRLQVTDLLGRSVLQKNISTDKNVQTLDLSNLNGGVYFVKLSTDNYSSTEKLIIQ